ncbi:MAG: quinohemoprotein amine dehydrogenase subunit alpha [Solimonas sp.]
MTIAQNECGIAVRLGRAVLCSILLSVSAAAVAEQPDARDAREVSELAETEAGIPVTDKLTLQKCGSCHVPDAKGNLSRISWLRTTPEGWSQAIKRMVRLNGLQISPQDARSIVRYLGTWHGLAPEEARPVMYMPEHRLIDETSVPDETVRQACVACHAFGQPLSWRRSQTEWALLQNMHVSLYASAEMQYRRNVPAAPGTKSTSPLTQGQAALEYLSKAAPLHTPEWAAWAPRIHAPMLAGKWLVSASMPGKGRYVGEMTIELGAAADAFTTVTTLRSLTDGSTLTRKGSGLVYGGYSWRGRSDGGAAKDSAPDVPGAVAREALWFSPDQQTAEGRWFWGAYQEFGFDVKLIRAGAGATVAGIAPLALKSGSTGVNLHIYGAGLPVQATTQDVDLGAGVTVKRVVSAKPDELVVMVDVAAGAMPGVRDVVVRGSVLEKALPVYDRIDYLKVAPDSNAIAHLGGIRFPKGYQQFEAVAYAKGADGKPHTEDDIAIGAVDVDWSVAEFPTVINDDDTRFVGSLSSAGLFTPNVEGPAAERRFGRNNYGEIWVVATARNEKDASGQPLSARSYLVVTVPLYKQFDQPEVAP